MDFLCFTYICKHFINTLPDQVLKVEQVINKNESQVINKNESLK